MMEFSFDSTRVEAECTVFATDFCFRPPAGMKNYDGLMKSVSSSLNLFPFYIYSLFCTAYFNSKNRSLLIITMSHNKLPNRKDEILKNNNMVLQSDMAFYKDNLLFHQLLYSDANNMMLILLHPEEDIVIEFYFMIPLNIYNSYQQKY